MREIFEILGSMLPVIVIFIVLFLAAVLGSHFGNKKRRENERRQQQKLLDRQNNIGRRIYNALDRLIHRLDVSKCVVKMCEDDPDGFQILVVETGCTIKWLEIHVDLVHRLRLMNCLTPIRVYKNGQWFEELWPESDVAIEELISSLENYILEHFAPTKV